MTTISLRQRGLQLRLQMRRLSLAAWLAIVVGVAAVLGNFVAVPYLEQSSTAMDLRIQQSRGARGGPDAGGAGAAGSVGAAGGTGAAGSAGAAGATGADNTVPNRSSVGASPAARLAVWRAQLGDFQQVHDSIGRIFALANRYELRIERADYEQTARPVEGLVIYRVQLETVAPYAVLRRYCDDVLRQFAFVALDELMLERESVATDALRAKMRFSLHLNWASS